MRNASAFCLLSHHENFGIAVAEAMACGTPVLITDQVQICDDVMEYKAGLVVALDVKAAAMGLRILLSNVSISQNMSSAGKRLVQERFNWRSIAESSLTYFGE